MEELVTSFVKGREDMLEYAKQPSEPEERPKKRRKMNGTPSPLDGERRSTRSRSKKAEVSANQETRHEVADSEDEVGSLYEVEADPPPKQPVPQDSLVPCPICGRRMKEEAVYTHLDLCDGTRRSNSPAPGDDRIARHFANTKPESVAYSVASHTKQKERLPTLNYSMLAENALRKKLKELGIPNHGPKALLQKRHVEWMNLWNANCDSRTPSTKRELLAELDTWERTQGRQVVANNGPSGVMAKDFDGIGWMQGCKCDFDDLIAKARAKKEIVSTEPLETGSSEREHEAPAPQEHSMDAGSFQPPSTTLSSKTSVTILTAGDGFTEEETSLSQSGQRSMFFA